MKSNATGRLCALLKFRARRHLTADSTTHSHAKPDRHVCAILVEVAHVKAHRTKKEKEKMTKFERFVTKGNETADKLAKAGAMLDEGFMAEVRADTFKQGREEVYVALQYAARFHCLVEE